MNYIDASIAFVFVCVCVFFLYRFRFDISTYSEFYIIKHFLRAGS